MTKVVFLAIHPLKHEELPAHLRSDDPIEMPEVPRAGDRIEDGEGAFQAEVLQVAWVWDEERGYWWAGVHLG